jgi:hypothetical protein
MALDHPLRCEVSFDPVADSQDIAVVSKPLGTFSAKAKALEPESNTGLAMALDVGLFIAFLSTDSARVTPRLSAHCTLSFGRSGFLRGLRRHRHVEMRKRQNIGKDTENRYNIFAGV